MAQRLHYSVPTANGFAEGSDKEDEMKKTLIALTCGLVLALSASTAQAVTINDDNYLGSLANATPSDSASQITYINHLIGMAVNTTQTDPPTNLPGNNTNFTRSDEPCSDFGGCPAATAGISDQAPSANINVTGWTWLYVKYGGGAHVWYVGNLSGSIPVPLDGGALGGQSHYALYNLTTQVPDGGATLGLLGLGMLGLGYLRRRKQ